jgi:23S rRNA pseudouridine955/2504/2580 synthase
MPYTTIRYEIGPDDAGRRLDRVVKSIYSSLQLSTIYRLFRTGNIRISGARVEPSYKAVAGEVLEVRTFQESGSEYANRDAGDGNPSASSFFKSLILLETPSLVVVNKPKGVLAHGSGGVDEAAKAYFADRIASSLSFTPAPLHRLDRNTSGALAVSASIAGATAFSEALRNGQIGKTYLALLTGRLEAEVKWVDHISRDETLKKSILDARGLLAESKAVPLLVENGYTLAVIFLGTGRTHQIRVQAAAHDHPLAGDSKYGGKPIRGGYMLHCSSLKIPAGIASGEQTLVKAPLPGSTRANLEKIFGRESISKVGCF